jgi:tetratricopeptide (TPR) repeat protein
MNSRGRLLCTSLIPTLGLSLIVVLALAVSPAAAQSDDAQQPTGQTPQATAEEEESSRRARKEAAKQERIDEYLRKREQREAEKEENRQARAAKQAEDEARDLESEQIAAQEETDRKARQATAATAATVAVTTTGSKARGSKDKSTRLPKGLARAQANIRATELALDPAVQDYLNLIDEQGASAHQLAAFGSFIAQNGMVRDAQEYYEVALRLEPNDAVLWINSGTLQLQTKNMSAAVSDFSRALAINPNSAVAHYNLGAALHEMNRYEDAVAAYKTALTIDPTLGDPAENPQAANNGLLLAVKLMLYQEQAGGLSHPLLEVSPDGSRPMADHDTGQ